MEHIHGKSHGNLSQHKCSLPHLVGCDNHPQWGRGQLRDLLPVPQPEPVMLRMLRLQPGLLRLARFLQTDSGSASMRQHE